MNRTAAIVLLLAASTIGAASASAQNRQVEATVPFTFTAGESTLPAGTYTIGLAGLNSNVINLSSWENKVNVLARGVPDEGYGKRANELVFHRYGNQYFLTEIRTTDSSLDMHLPETKAEKRARKETEEAGLFPNDPVLIALNR